MQQLSSNPAGSDRAVRLTSNPACCVACDALLGSTQTLELVDQSLVRCTDCQTWTGLPRPSQASQSSLHDTGEYFGHPYFRARRDRQSLASKRCQSIFNQISRVTDSAFLRGSRMLDVGCDDGSFLLAAAELHGVTPMGVDVSSRAVEIALSRGLRVFHGVLEQATPDLNGFSVVTAVDVLEHMANPAAFLQGVRERMAPEGILYIQTPNPASAVYGLGRILNGIPPCRPSGAIRRLFPPEHIQYFSAAGLRALADRCGFEVADLSTRTLPLPEIVAGNVTLAALAAVQCLDRVRHTEILLCAVLRRQ